MMLSTYSALLSKDSYRRAQVGLAAKLIRQSKIKKDSFGVTDVQIAVGLGRKTGLDSSVTILLRSYIFNNRVADEV